MMEYVIIAALLAIPSVTLIALLEWHRRTWKPTPDEMRPFVVHERLDEYMANTTDQPPEIADAVNEHFWEMYDSEEIGDHT